MDLGVYARVLWRFKFLVAGGLLLAILLATLSLAKVSLSHGVTYRKPLTYESTSTVLLTKKGFPYGSLVDAVGTAPLTSLATFYAQLASSNAIKERLQLRQGLTGGIDGRPVIDRSSGSSVFLPMVAIDGFSTSPRAAVELAGRATQAFIDYVRQQQGAAKIPAANRVVLQVMDPASGASVVAPRKKTLPIMIFVLVVSATLGLAFALENLRPSVRLVGGQLHDDRAAANRRPSVETGAEESARSKSA